MELKAFFRIYLHEKELVRSSAFHYSTCRVNYSLCSTASADRELMRMNVITKSRVLFERERLRSGK